MSSAGLNQPPIKSLHHPIFRMKLLQKVLVHYAVVHAVMSNRKALERQCIERAVMKVGTTFAATAQADTQLYATCLSESIDRGKLYNWHKWVGSF